MALALQLRELRVYAEDVEKDLPVAPSISEAEADAPRLERKAISLNTQVMQFLGSVTGGPTLRVCSISAAGCEPYDFQRCAFTSAADADTALGGEGDGCSFGFCTRTEKSVEGLRWSHEKLPKEGCLFVSAFRSAEGAQPL